MKKFIIIFSLLSIFLLSGCEDVLNKFSDSYKNIVQPIQNKYQADNTDYTEISDQDALRNYVLEMSDADELQFSFVYTGKDKPDPGVIAQMAGACFVEIIQEGDIHHVTLTEFPGSRIVDAYFSNDAEKLTEDEQLALEEAVKIANEAKERTSDNWELELAIHDLLAERITYSDADIFYEEPEDQPRHLSVIGALLDGEANCQGYTDAFYTVASIAGFAVDRQSVETDTDPHMVNTICLDGDWYVVDLTYNDSDDESISYRLFNAGMDMIAQEYEWAAEVERHPIIPESNDYNYFIRNDLCFRDVLKLAEYVARMWARYGETEIQALLMDEDEAEKLNEILPAILESYGKSYRYSIWYSTNGEDSFYTIVFTD